ncbi:MAG TPA: dockerin type I domain-containing protein [Candidatus Acidoferrales bacterium]|nr:dockerin type I domain-containing protein [Candidatus Acidoferrales bacterium]
MRLTTFSRHFATAALIASLAACRAEATTFVAMDDSVLAKSSDVILIGTVTGLESGEPTDGEIYTYVHLQVESVLRSHLDAPEVVLREPGGTFGGMTDRLFGAPQFQVGERCLLFLKRDAQGALRTNQLALGKFTIAKDDVGRDIATRAYDSGTTGVDPTLSAPYSPGSETRLLDSLIATIRGVDNDSFEAPPVTPIPDELDNMLTEYKEPFQIQSPTPARWFEPDSATPIQYFVDPNGDATIGASGSRTAFDDALAAWTNVSSANIILTDGGTLGSPLPNYPGCTGVNRVVFNDPYDYLGGSGCSGVIGFGGYCYNSSPTTVVNGTTFGQIVLGKVVLQSGLNACSGWSQCNLAELLTHEIGHSIGLAHSSENPSEPNATLKDATMYYAAHFDGRCASVHSDDIAGVSFIYPYTGPSLTPTLTFTATRTPTITPTPSLTPTRTPTNTPTRTSSPTSTITGTPTKTPTPTSTPTITLTPIFSSTPTGTSTPTPTFTPTPTPTITATSERTPPDGISGHVYYYGNAVPVDGVTLNLSGSGSDTAITDATGLYPFPGLADATWTTMPTKSGNTNGAVTALDATFVLQATVGSRAFSAAQILAGDTNGSGTITAIDATLILQYRVGLISKLPVAGTTRCNSDWAFFPSTAGYAGASATLPSPLPTPCVYGKIDYASLPAQAKNQDYYAVIFGDTTGSWTSPTGGGGEAAPPARRSRVRLGRPQTARSGALHVPVMVDASSRWHGLDLDVHYDSAAVRLRGVRRLNAARGALLQYNSPQPGTLKISVASLNGVDPREPALLLIFENQHPGARSPRLRVLASAVDEH